MALNAREAGPASGAAEDPSIADIVVALRGATGARAGHSVTPVHAAPTPAGSAASRPALPRSAASDSDEAGAVLAGMPPSPVSRPIAEDSAPDDLRDAEIARLIEQNHRLNAQIFHLLKLIEREKARLAEERAAAAARQLPAPLGSGDAVGREVRAALEAELRPILGALLRLVQRMAAERTLQRAAVAGEAMREQPLSERGPARGAGERAEAAPVSSPPPSRPVAPPRRDERDRHANWIIDLIQAASDRGGAERLQQAADRPLERPAGEPAGSSLFARLRRGLRRFGVSRTE